MMDWVSDGQFLQLLFCSLAGAVVGCSLSCVSGVHRLTALTLVFFLQFLIGLTPEDFVMFAAAALAAALVSSSGHKMGRRSLVMMAGAVMALLFFSSELALFVIQAKSVGMIHVVLVILLANLLFAKSPVSKGMIALALGMVTAQLGSYLTSSSLHLPLDLFGWTEGTALIIVLAGTCVFSPLLCGPVVPRESVKANNSADLIGLNLIGILSLLLFGIGTSIESIVLFAMLNYENVPFGAMAFIENGVRINQSLLAVLFSVLFVLLLQKTIVKDLRLLFTKIPLWMVHSMIAVIAITTLCVLDLGVFSIYLALIFGFVGMALEKSGMSTPLFLVGYIYGSHLGYLFEISILARQTLFQLPLLLSALLFAALLVVGKMYWRRKQHS
ncbi:hypothetical protein [uncultured Desulfuromonas sp.]|uniref:hypothetical protein n=1 Tax=uncultured Desulfuromonas sp. TaxID=181013 RepID=UPI002AABC513|nr:hypothetical protein [uncultured Desulfuromonas sp.]